MSGDSGYTMVDRRGMMVRVLGGSMFVLIVGCGIQRPNADSTRSSTPTVPRAVVETDDPRWQKVTEPRDLVFPDDHGPHESYRLEWWYYTGNLWSQENLRFGYQLTFFRTGIQWDVDTSSRWAVRDLYIAHFAVSDAQRRTHRFWERIHRAGPGWAGATPRAERIWNGDWQLRMEHDTAANQTRHHLKAQAEDVQIELTLLPIKPVVLHGDRGFSRKGAAEGNASYYYSLTRLQTSGTLVLNGRTHHVQGESWMDHEFSSSFLEESQSGWDWFSIQLDNQCELMLYQMRRKSGEPDAASSGTVVLPDGRTHTLDRQQFLLRPGRNWVSKRTGGNYPVEWSLEIPPFQAQLSVKCVFDAQEMNTQRSTGMAYWEGCIDVQGTWQSKPVRGHGYLEMTGRVPASSQASYGHDALSGVVRRNEGQYNATNYEY